MANDEEKEFSGFRWSSESMGGEYDPEWVADMEKFHKDQERIEKEPRMKLLTARIKARAKAQRAELRAWHIKCREIAKETLGEYYDPKNYIGEDE
ncbi:MAG: hypothetical protein LBI10_02740 [Deltaproteobacteria bacterium]|jgi:hypothetical protein|nr:hypothetical protein [Deltaproteobacteria bacterium]